ncbi:molybdopterin molybdenumtransferase MoeA [Eikenella longinqua]|uniref:Molybdopterin molybdenumtransferase n=1 Tax=Eikenella longinqua TaxID=1795827 RepID=A0A1A9S1X8_9NEIS|nr:gephyrin-like molybdotransferase Glp [Eikenella longinqua]OAM30832.1 molybdopterin molybdenumtransferase MoeA [Eikenella longinqua]
MALTPVHELQARIHEKIAAARKPPASERVPLVSALGRVLAQDVASALNLPPADISAMDGYALPEAAAAGSEWRIAGESVAGQPFSGSLPEGGCVRIMTGAVVPAGCRSVVIQENVQADGGIIRLEKDAAEGGNIRRCGEEIAAGETVLQAGRILRQADIMLLAALGCAEIEVFHKVRVAVLSSGDELLEPGEPATRSGSIYDSNRYMLMARLSALPVEVIDFGQVADKLEDVLKMLDKVIQQADVLITTGGVSVGDYDFMREAVERVGSIHHYKVALKPGKPFVFGQMLNTWCFGLPGNPVSGFVGFDMFVKAALWQLCGAAEIPQPLRFAAKLAEPAVKNHSRTDIQRAIISRQPDGTWLAAPFGSQDSHRIYQVSRANAYLILPAESGSLPAGAEVTVQPFAEAFL